MRGGIDGPLRMCSVKILRSVCGGNVRGCRRPAVGRSSVLGSYPFGGCVG